MPVVNAGQETLADFSLVPTEGNVNSFADTWPSNPFYEYVENLASNQITTGCGGGKYCPNASVTRAQMAVFLLKTEHGSAYLPPDCAGNAISFLDVPCPSQYANWIAAPKVGIDSKPGDFEYVKIA